MSQAKALSKKKTKAPKQTLPESDFVEIDPIQLPEALETHPGSIPTRKVGTPVQQLERSGFELLLEAIVIGKRERQYNKTLVQELRINIEDVGLIHPITVTTTAEQDRYLLVAGRHRLEAFRLLAAEGKSAYRQIPVTLIQPADARRVELCENLYRNELSILEKAEHLDIYLRTTHETVSEAIESLAKAARQSERTFFRYKAIGSGLQVAQEIKERHPVLANSTRQLYFLATQCQKDEQRAILKILRKQPDLTVQQAYAQLQGEQAAKYVSERQVPVLVPSSLRNQIGSLSKAHQMKKGEFMERFLASALKAYEQGSFELISDGLEPR